MKETREETYRKVFIKSEADYPKTEGEYFCCRNGFKSVQRLIPDDGKKSYMREIDWYLQPQEQDPEADIPKHPTSYRDFTMTEQEKQTADIPIAYEFHCLKTGHCYVDYIKDVSQEQEGQEYIQRELFYASQSQSSVLPSEEEIEKEAMNKVPYKVGKWDNKVSERIGWIEGAKWLKSQLKQGYEKRKLLKDFNSFMCGNQWDGRIPLIDQCIDEFLKDK